MGQKQVVRKPEQPAVVRRVSWVVLVGIMVALAFGTLAVYYQVRTHEFIQFDDPEYVTNPNGAQIRHLFESHEANLYSIKWAFDPDGHCSNWHPLTWLSHMVVYHFFPLTDANGHEVTDLAEVVRTNAGGHHMVNVALHIISTLLLFLALFKMTGSHWKSAFVAALFAIHPAHIESVAWVSELKDVLSTVFWMLTMLVYAHYVRSKGWKAIALYVGVLVSFALGLLAKPMLVTLPFVLLLLDWWPLGRFAPVVVEKKRRTRQQTSEGYPQWLMIVLEKVPLLGMAAFASYMTYRAQHFAVASGTLTFPMRLDNVVVALMNYIGKLFWPVKLSVNYPHPGQFLNEAAITLSFFGFAALLIVTLGVCRRLSYVKMGWLWFLGTLVPVCGLFVQVGEQGMADRYTYIPYIGLFIIIAWGVPAMLDWYFDRAKVDAKKLKPMVLGITAGVVIAALSVSTYTQLAYWKSSDTLFRHAIEVAPANITAEINLGKYLENMGHRDEAIQHYNAALAVNDRHVRSLNLLGTAYLAQSYVTERGPEQSRLLALAIKKYQDALQYSSDPLVMNNLASAYNNIGRPADAVPYLKQAIGIKADLEVAYVNLANSYTLLGQFDKAIDIANQLLAVNPNSGEAYGKLASAYFGLKDYRSSARAMAQAKSLGVQVNSQFESMLAAKLGGSR